MAAAAGDIEARKGDPSCCCSCENPVNGSDGGAFGKLIIAAGAGAAAAAGDATAALGASGSRLELNVAEDGAEGRGDTTR